MLRQFWTKIYRDDRRLELWLLAFMVVFYGCLLSEVGLRTYPIDYHLTFNSMLAHLLHGRFDVDPQAVGAEGFFRNGRVYSYWGIWCALLRLPLWAINRLDLDMTVWSCLAAVCLAGAAKVRTVLFLRRQSAALPETLPGQTAALPGQTAAFGFMLLYLLFGGSQIAYLKASIFQEVVLWATAFAAVFVYLCIVGIVQGFTRRTLCGLAACAGLSLLTRVSTGLGLCVAFGLLLLVLLVKQGLKQGLSRYLLPMSILAALLVGVGAVNYFRWGNPLTFADHHLYLFNSQFPDRMPRTWRYGYFNLRRIPFGLQYYFFPVWELRGSSGLLLAGVRDRLMDATELPPGSFFFTDLLPIAFLGFTIAALQRKRLPAWPVVALTTGLAVPCGLMLMAISMCYRYRMEFYPLLQLLAFLGLYAVVTDESQLAHFRKRLSWFRAAAVVSVVSAFAAMVLYKLSPFGPPQALLQQGIVHFYAAALR